MIDYISILTVPVSIVTVRANKYVPESHILVYKKF